MVYDTRKLWCFLEISPCLLNQFLEVPSWIRSSTSTQPQRQCKSWQSTYSLLGIPEMLSSRATRACDERSIKTTTMSQSINDSYLDSILSWLFNFWNRLVVHLYHTLKSSRFFGKLAWKTWWEDLKNHLLPANLVMTLVKEPSVEVTQMLATAPASLWQARTIRTL